MSTRVSLVEFICEQIADVGCVKYKKMFGEYMVYVNEKPVFLLCDDTVFVKINDVSTLLLGEDAPKGYPYEHAKIHFIVEDIDNGEFMKKLASELERITIKK